MLTKKKSDWIDERLDMREPEDRPWSGDIEVLDKIVAGLSYKPGWQIWLSRNNYDRTIGMLYADYPMPDARCGTGLTCIHTINGCTDHTETITVHYQKPVPKYCDDWMMWLRMAILESEAHECDEWFQVNSEIIYDPHKTDHWRLSDK